MNNIESKAAIWRERFKGLMKEKGYTQEAFLKEYKNRYGGGTQANISRWLRVGSKIIQNGTVKTIGFPSYENMLNIADFFGVTVGYLTGETDFETYDLEKTCQFIGIDEETCKAIKSIASGESIKPFGKFRANDFNAALKYLVTADNFPAFIKLVRQYIDNVYYQAYPVNHVDKVIEKIGNKRRSDLAMQYIDCLHLLDNEISETDNFNENNIKQSPELIQDIQMLEEAIDKNYDDEVRNEQMVKLSEYELQKKYFELINDIVSDNNLLSMHSERVIHRWEKDNQIE